MKLLVTQIVNGELGTTVTFDCRDLVHATEMFKSLGAGYVGCAKLGDKIKTVF